MYNRRDKEMIRNYLSSPEGQKAIGEFVTTPKGKRGNETGSARLPQVFVPARDLPLEVSRKLEKNSLEKT